VGVWWQIRSETIGLLRFSSWGGLYFVGVLFLGKENEM
jgi:hypothetical protein